MVSSMTAAHRRPTTRLAPIEEAASLRVHVGDLLGRRGVVRPLRRRVPVGGLSVAGSRLDAHEPVDLDVRLEAIAAGVLVSGRLAAHWTGECSRCLAPVGGGLSIEVHELFERSPLEGETYPLEGEEIDLELVVRDAVALHLPLVPLCSDACHGLCPTCGANRNESPCGCGTQEPDPRWAALDQLQRPEESS